MAVGVVLEIEGGTLEQYDEVIKRMGLHAGRPRSARWSVPLGNEDGRRDPCNGRLGGP